MQAKDRMDVPKSLRKDWEDLVSPSSSLASPGTGDVRASTKAGQKPTPTNRTEAVKNAMTADVDSIEILRQIRESADAVVYEAWDHSAKRDVAIHMLRTEAQSDTSLVDDFWRRSQSQAKTDHSNIVSIYSIEQPAGRVVAEFCKPAFDEELPKNGWSEAEVRRLLQDTLSGLEYLHRQGKIHGALAPAVIMSSEMGTFKLDRISGRRVGEELQLLPGNEKYLAPEILDESRFGAVGEAVDLYALGMIALEALSGRKFLSCFADCGLDLEAGGETWLRWHAASEERVAEVATVLPKVDPRLAATIDRLLSKQVGDRPRSASDALAILNSHTPTIVASTERTNSSVTSLSASDLALRPSAVTARRTEGSALSTVATMGMESRNAPASWQQRLDGLFAEENANKVAAGILLLVTFIAGLAFFEPQKSQEDEGPAIDFSIIQEPVIVPAPPEPTPEPPEEEVLVEDTVEPPPPAAPQPPRPTTGRLVVYLEPADAWLEIDGERRRVGDALVLPYGEHLVMAGKWDRIRESRRVQVERGRSQVVSINLAQRTPTPRYEPVLDVNYPGASEADDIVRTLITELWTENKMTLTLSRIKRQARQGSTSGVRRDARILHAIAVLSAGQGDDLDEALEWYSLAAQAAPAPYSWPDKGEIKTLLMLDQKSAALRRCKEFVYDAADCAEGLPESQRARQYLVDTAAFVGRIIGLVEVVSGQRETELVFADLREYLTFAPYALDGMKFAYQQVQERYRESAAPPVVNLPRLVREYLGESLTEERRALRNSIGRRNADAGEPRTRVRIPKNTRNRESFPSQVTGDNNSRKISEISGRSLHGLEFPM